MIMSENKTIMDELIDTIHSASFICSYTQCPDCKYIHTDKCRSRLIANELLKKFSIKSEEKLNVPENEDKSNSVNHPSHYLHGKIEVIDYIEDKGFNFNKGNAVKYISRAGLKDKN